VAKKKGSHRRGEGRRRRLPSLCGPVVLAQPSCPIEAAKRGAEVTFFVTLFLAAPGLALIFFWHAIPDGEPTSRQLYVVLGICIACAAAGVALNIHLDAKLAAYGYG